MTRVRAVVAILLGSALCAGVASASQGLKPPVIHETFTPLPCPMHPQTTVAMEGCDEQAILGTDRAINAQAKAIFGLLRSHAARLAFVQGEKAWLSFRRSSCTAEASAYAGGSFEPVAYGSCVVARNRTHLTDLAALRKALGRH